MTKYRKTWTQVLGEVREDKEVVLESNHYKYDGKVVKISKKNFSKVHKDYKNSTKGKETMLINDPKTNGTISVPVQFEEVELEEEFWAVIDKAKGGEVLTNHQVVSIKQHNNLVKSVEVIEKNGVKKTLECDGIINASGPWSGKIAKLVDQEVELQLTKGSVMVFSHRLVSQAINRCRIPSSNDIMCPSGTVSLWGTTSEIVNDPDTTKIRPEEIQELLMGAEELFPNVKNYRSFRAWAGVRPLVKPKNFDKNKNCMMIKRIYAMAQAFPVLKFRNASL